MSQDMNRDDNHNVEQRLRAALRPVDAVTGAGDGLVGTVAGVELPSCRERSTSLS